MKNKDFDYDEDYEVDIRIWREKGMPNSKQMIKTSNSISVITATTSFIENLLRLGIVDEKILDDMIEMAKSSAKGEVRK